MWMSNGFQTPNSAHLSWSQNTLMEMPTPEPINSQAPDPTCVTGSQRKFWGIN